MRAKVAVLVGTKGRGSNMSALIEACQAGHVPADVVIVVSPRDGTGAAERARELGVRVEVLPANDETYAQRLIKALRAVGATWVCLAGLMTKLPPEVLDTFPGHVVNIHPALLPKFGGKGMWGIHVHEAVIAARELVSGCTVHIVTTEYDEGPIVLQLTCPVFPNDSPESLSRRVLALEHAAYPLALKSLIEGDVG